MFYLRALLQGLSWVSSPAVEQRSSEAWMWLADSFWDASWPGCDQKLDFLAMWASVVTMKMSLQGRKSREGATGRELWRLLWPSLQNCTQSLLPFYMHANYLLIKVMLRRRSPLLQRLLGLYLCFTAVDTVVQSNWHALTTCCYSKRVAGKDSSFILVVEQPNANHLVMPVPQFPLPVKWWLD